MSDVVARIVDALAQDTFWDTDAPPLLRDAVAEIKRLRAESSNRLQFVDRITDAFLERRWIPVSERLPDAGDDGYARVIGWDGVRVSEMYFHPRMKNGDQWSSYAGHESPAHWMPLPEPPEMNA